MKYLNNCRTGDDIVPFTTRYESLAQSIVFLVLISGLGLIFIDTKIEACPCSNVEFGLFITTIL